jgi:hypothetical protein
VVSFVQARLGVSRELEARLPQKSGVRFSHAAFSVGPRACLAEAKLQQNGSERGKGEINASRFVGKNYRLYKRN